MAKKEQESFRKTERKLSLLDPFSFTHLWSAMMWFCKLAGDMSGQNKTFLSHFLFSYSTWEEQKWVFSRKSLWSVTQESPILVRLFQTMHCVEADISANRTVVWGSNHRNLPKAHLGTQEVSSHSPVPSPPLSTVPLLYCPDWGQQQTSQVTCWDHLGTINWWTSLKNWKFMRLLY